MSGGWKDLVLAKYQEEISVLKAINAELAEALRRVDHTLTVHGKVDANTDLHAFVRAALAKVKEQK